jgi:hypothetical protein
MSHHWSFKDDKRQQRLQAMPNRRRETRGFGDLDGQRTVAKVHSIGFVVRRWIQRSARVAVGLESMIKVSSRR